MQRAKFVVNLPSAALVCVALVAVIVSGCAAGGSLGPGDSGQRDQNVRPDGGRIDQASSDKDQRSDEHDSRSAPDQSADLAPDQGRPCSAGCDDGLACTIDTCVANRCQHEIEAKFCVIDGACMPDGRRDAECHVCDPSKDQHGWSDQASLCADDGLTCTSASCSAGTCGQAVKAGQCLFGSTCLQDGASAPGNPCQVCDGSTRQVAAKPNGDPCTPDNLACTDDVCQAGQCEHAVDANHCLVGGNCFLSGTRNPTNPCSTCQPSKSKTVFSQAVDGTTCDSDGLPCTDDVCQQGNCRHPLQANRCLIGGTCYDSGEEQLGQQCLRCNPLVATDAWTTASDGTPCSADGFSCTDDICQQGSCQHPLNANSCLIGGQCYAGGQQNPSSSCQHCDPTRTVASWTAKPNGAGCASDGLTCTDDICQQGACQHPLQTDHCLIDGTCYAAGAEQPADSCRTCQPARSAVSWQQALDGKTCTSDGLSCTDDVCQSGVCQHNVVAGNCLVGGTCYSQDEPITADGCQSCIPAQSVVAATPQDGRPCTDSDPQTPLDVCLGGSCHAYDIYTFALQSSDTNTTIHDIGQVPGVGTYIVGEYVDSALGQRGFAGQLADGATIASLVTVSHPLYGFDARMAVGAAGTAIYFNGTSWSYANDVTSHVGSTTRLAGVWGTTTGGTRSFFVAGAAGTLSRCNTTNNGASFSCQDVGGIPATDDLVAISGTTSGSSPGPLWAVRGETREDIYYSSDGSSFSTAGPAGCDAGGATPCSSTPGRFRDVWARAASDVWAVGEGGLVMHYDGSGWQTVAIPNLPTQAPQNTHTFNGVFASGDLVVLVGHRIWNGQDKDLIVIFYNQRLQTWYPAQLVYFLALTDPEVDNWDITAVGGANPSSLRFVGHSWSTLSSRQTGMLLLPP